MITSFLNEIILQCLHKINGQRTIYSIYHLLNGKKSSQTIQDAHLFQLGSFFKTCSDLSRNHLEKSVMELESLQFLVREQDHIFTLTNKGVEHARTFTSVFPFLTHLNGWKYPYADVFWQRLALFVQVVSNMHQHETKYIPIQRNKKVQAWLKGFISQNKYVRSELSEILYHDLIRCLDKANGIDPAVVVIRLSGYGDAIGQTEQQASVILGMEQDLYHFHFISALHYMIEEIQSNKDAYRILGHTLNGLHVEIPITESTKRTYRLLHKGYSLEEIAHIRNLKISTIQDHIVELALYIDSFDITPYVDVKIQREVIAASQRTTSKQLKHIRELVKDVDYFAIRLVMARFGEIK